MGRFRYGKPDDNQAAIVETYRKCGWSVAITSAVGNGFPDLVVGYMLITYIVEVKVKKKKLRKSQTDFAACWKGSPVIEIRSVEDAINHINSIIGI